MVKIEFVHKLKSIIDDKGNCYTKTTEKKCEGFIPNNVHDVKWGQVDVEKLRIRVVIDLYPGKYNEEDLKEHLGLSLKNKRKRITGFYLEKTDEFDPPFHDVAIITLYNDYFEQDDYDFSKLLRFMSKTADEAYFKTEYPERLRKG
jgi:hypothetical protein